MTRTAVVATLLCSTVLASPALAQPAAPPDARWNAYLGCWRAVDDTASTGARICVAPRDAGVTLTTHVAGQRVSEDTRVADGVARDITADGCSGQESARWSGSGHRLFRAATVTCDSGPRTLATVSFFVAGGTWVDVETVTHEGSTSVRVSRLVRAPAPAQPDGAASSRPAVARGPSVEATAPFTVDDVIELSAHLPADGVQAALAEAPTTFRLNAPALVKMAEANVGDRVIDLMVGLTYPAKFQVQAVRSMSLAGPAGLGVSMGDPFFTPIVGPAALFSCYSPYGWANSSYWGSCARFDPMMMSMFPGFYSGYWGPYGADWIVTQPGIGTGGVTPLPAEGGGRLVNGRGYTQVQPIDTSYGSSSGGGSGRSSGMDGGSGNSGGSSGVSGSGYSGGGSMGGGGGGGDRMAVPRGPGY